MTTLAETLGGTPIQNAMRPGSGAGDVETLAIGAAAVNGAAMPEKVSVVRLVATGDCHIRIAAGAVAVAGDTLLQANQAEYFKVQEGDRVSVIQDGAATGNLFVSRMR